MSKSSSNSAKTNSEASSKASSPPTQSTNISHYILQFTLILSAFLVGILIQNYYAPFQSIQQVKTNEYDNPIPSSEYRKITESPIDMDALYKEMSEKIKREIYEEYSKKQVAENEKQKKDEEIKETQIKKNVNTVDDQKVTDQTSEIKFKNDGSPQTIVIDPNSINEKNSEALRKQKMLEKAKEKEKIREREKNLKQNKGSTPTREIKKEASSAEATITKKETEVEVPDEIKNFASVKISQMKPKKMWIPIPNSNGGHRRCPAIEIREGKAHGSSVKVSMYEEFLSEEETKSLIEAHESHLKELVKERPIICFDSVKTLRQNLINLNREKIAELVSPLDFTQGTYCLNQTFSRQLEKWGLKWSFNTAFYPGESKFSKYFAKLIEDATMLNATHGGKFLITSYPHDVGFKSHTPCNLDSNDARDKYGAFIVFLNELGADGGGEHLFPELGIDVKPRGGRALTWNCMNYETAKCESASAFESAPVKHEVKKKYVIQRFYYYKNFYTLGKRLAEAHLPERPPNTPKVSCSSYDNSCHMFDEWDPDHLIEYQRNKKLY